MRSGVSRSAATARDATRGRASGRRATRRRRATIGGAANGRWREIDGQAVRVVELEDAVILRPVEIDDEPCRAGLRAAEPDVPARRCLRSEARHPAERPPSACLRVEVEPRGAGDFLAPDRDFGVELHVTRTMSLKTSPGDLAESAPEALYGRPPGQCSRSWRATPRPSALPQSAWLVPLEDVDPSLACRR